MKRVRAIVAALTCASVLTAGAGCSSTSAPVDFSRDDDGFTVRLASLPLMTQPTESLDAAVVNSGRGQYAWLGIPTDPAGWPAVDTYYRDEVQWGRDLERSRQKYDFSTIDRGLKAAAAHGGRLSFRVMAWCPGCGENLAPSWLPRQKSGAPDWNSEVFLSSWEHLMAALGKRYDDDPRLYSLDLGGYGAAGEWYWKPSYGTPISDANARRMMRATLGAFPNTFVLVPWLDGRPEMAVALGIGRPGIRNDCVGGSEQVFASHTPAVQDIWRAAPIVGEWCNSSQTTSALALQNVTSFHMSMLSSGNHPVLYAGMSPAEKETFLRVNQLAGFRFRLARLTFAANSDGPRAVTTQWENSGSSPSYDTWRVVLTLQPEAGGSSLEVPLASDFTKQGTGVTAPATVGQLPAGLHGRHRVGLRVVDEGGHLPPLRLAMTERSADGTYPLGVVDLD